eukprot:TRINITY_DN229_c0_g1_i5.p1 TRINITY_DN229_c0_g1~~TRINITY_DN229_c0_g1_i5.p1  ORF type:complete len:334 (-),score=80.16 TRINITY_DN229_c0_g1_i5:143-1144(-)
MDQAQGAVFPPMESLKVNGERGFFPSTPESPCTTLCPFQEKCRNQKERKKSLRLQPTTNYVSTSTSTSISTQTQTTTCRGDKQSQNGIWGTKTTTPTTTELKKTINNTIILFPDFSITLPIKDSCTFQKALDDEIKPFLSVSHLDFFIRPTTQDPPGPLGMHEDVAKRVWKHLSPSSKRLALDPNAGGNSVWSEVYSFEVLQRAFGAELVKTEMEIEYWPEGSKKNRLHLQDRRTTRWSVRHQSHEVQRRVHRRRCNEVVDEEVVWYPTIDPKRQQGIQLEETNPAHLVPECTNHQAVDRTVREVGRGPEVQHCSVYYRNPRQWKLAVRCLFP